LGGLLALSYRLPGAVSPNRTWNAEFRGGYFSRS
jgi:hypothetical protein